VNALDRWRRELAGWAIPDEILAAAPESPWGFPPELFRSRAERTPADPSATTRVALDALGTGGEVLDGLWKGTGSGRRDPSSTRSSRCGGTAARRDGPPAGTA
jgi:hypothetical protein